ncbi:TfoX/Sxy family protein [Pedobacter insulae]|nr:TfoX/Sxy family protein [Pedobacter insulae]
MKREFDTRAADQVREMLIDQKDVAEKEMFSGICFMVDEKLCICVTKENLLCRIGEEKVLTELEKGTCSQMVMNGRTSKNFVYVPIAENLRKQDLAYWVNLCLEYNPMAKSSKKKSK